ncbi:hypothetical protein [Rhizobium leguminosarum]|uniref:hypothetical protein n=1 Tax=Rhizobium leguminosarum TaxID=384 RepID=UPI0032AF04A3
MRISTITNWAYATTVVLTLISGGAFIMAVRGADMERDAATTAWKLDETVEQLQSAAEKTTEDARLYVIKGEERYLNAFRAVDAVEREREQSVKRLVISNLTDQERTARQSRPTQKCSTPSRSKPSRISPLANRTSEEQRFSPRNMRKRRPT